MTLINNLKTLAASLGYFPLENGPSHPLSEYCKLQNAPRYIQRFSTDSKNFTSPMM